MSELDLLIQEIKLKERESQIVKESSKLEEFKLECTFDKAMTSELVMSKFDGFFVQDI